MRLKDKIALITGAGNGIGRASAYRFAAEGARVAALDIDGAAVEATASALPAESPGEIPSYRVDVRKAAQVQDVVSRVLDRFGRLDVFYSNAAIMRGGSVVDLSEEDWDAMFAANVKVI